MEKEKFNDVEKELVNQDSLTHAEKIKIISEIKNAKSNDRQAQKIVFLTLMTIVIAGLSFAEDAIKGSSFPFPYNSVLYGTPILVILFLAINTLNRK
jgi:hypothetical protein